MVKLLAPFFLFNSISYTGLAQVQYSNDFSYIANAIKYSYAGYTEKVKGNEFDVLVKRLERSHSKDTFAILSQMTAFFRDHHLILYDLNIGAQKIDTQQCKKDSQMIQVYFANKNLKDKYEGYWLSDFNNCIIALKKVKSNPNTYYGYVVESKVKVMPGYCMLKMTEEKGGTYFTDYIQEKFGCRVFLHSKFNNLNTLWVNSFSKWYRINDYKSSMLKGLTNFSYQPDFKILDSNTVLLKMPDFGQRNVKRYDSIIKANASVIGKTKTLILDVRNNTGGTISNYLPLFPYIYTNPIVHCGVYTLYSDIYIKNYETIIQNYVRDGDTANAKLYSTYLDEVRMRKGQFEYSEPDTLAMKLPVLGNPQNVAIIINNNCLSATELMLLNFKQSTKVKIFGERTGGAIDYLDAYTLSVPSGKYSLFIATTKRALTSSQPSYDKTGIPPDIEISDKVKDWVGFVKKYYDERN